MLNVLESRQRHYLARLSTHLDRDVLKSEEMWRASQGSRAVVGPAPSIDVVSRFVELPLEVHWSHPLRAFDLDDPSDRVFVYETVLRQGDGAHIREFIDVDELLEIWDQLYLPANIEAAWADYFERVRGVQVTRRWVSANSRHA